MKTIDEIYKLPVGLANLDVYGLELEIEDIREVGENIGDFSTRPDGSLRNNGTEFVSTPLAIEQIEPALITLFKNIRIGKAAFSERTSIHVHCNMKGCSVEQLKSFLLLYMVFENVLFNYVHETRKSNIFCVPLKDFACPERLASSFGPLEAEKLTKVPQIHWEKYSALNILPLAHFGTVEFRHMHGNGDIPYISKWVEIIHTMKQACRQFPLEELRQAVRELNTSSQYLLFSEKIFHGVRDVLFSNLDSSSLKKAMYGAVTTAKLWEFHEHKYKKNLEVLAKNKLRVMDDMLAVPIAAAPEQGDGFNANQFWDDVRNAQAAQPRQQVVPQAQEAPQVHFDVPPNMWPAAPVIPAARVRRPGAAGGVPPRPVVRARQAGEQNAPRVDPGLPVWRDRDDQF